MRKCGSVCHSDDDSFDFLFEVAAGSKTHFKKLAAEAKQTLIDREYIKKWTKYICNRCVEKGTQTGKLHDHAEQEAIESNQNENDEEIINEAISCDKNTLEKICERVGNDLELVLREDIANLYKKRNYTIDELLEHDRPQELACGTANGTSYFIKTLVQLRYR